MPAKPPDIYFAHIPKTAGSSLASYIRSAYRQDECMPAHEWKDLSRMSRERIESYRCYHGHFGVSFLSLLQRDIATITFLRDPVERSLSHIKYGERYHRRHMFRYFGWTMRMALAGTRVQDEWIKPPLKNVVSDLQTRSLGIDIDLNPLLGSRDRRDIEFLFAEAARDRPMESVLERAKRRLEDMVVVGVAERFAESLQLVADLLGIPVPEQLPRENVSPGHIINARHSDSGEYSIEYLREIEAMNRYDLELYAYANELLDKQLDARKLVHRA